MNKLLSLGLRFVGLAKTSEKIPYADHCYLFVEQPMKIPELGKKFGWTRINNDPYMPRPLMVDYGDPLNSGRDYVGKSW